MTEEIKNDNIEQSESTALSTISDFVTELATGIPAPVRKNLFKAFGQLCTAVVDIPVAYLEGVAAEKRAVTDSRVSLVKSSGEQIAKHLDVDPEYAKAAVKRFGRKIVRERINIDKTCEAAAEEIKAKSVRPNSEQTEKTIGEINDDWLNNFEEIAAQKSTEEMQSLLGRILAGEIQRPTSFSIRTVKLLGDLDTELARLFQHLCTLSVSMNVGDHIVDVRVVSLGTNASSNGLRQYGLSFDQLNKLHEYGLIIPDYNSYIDFAPCIADPGRRSVLGFSFQNKTWALDSEVERPLNAEFRVHGVAFSRSGRELSRIMDLEPLEDETIQNYNSVLRGFFESNRLKMVQI